MKALYLIFVLFKYKNGAYNNQVLQVVYAFELAKVSLPRCLNNETTMRFFFHFKASAIVADVLFWQYKT